VHQASRTNYTEIAQNMITNTHLDVILGAGHPLFDNNGVAVSAEVVLDSLGNSIGGTPFYDYIGGASLYEKLKAGTATNLDGSWAFIESLSDFEKYASFSSDSLPDRLIGIAPVLYSLQSSRGNGPMLLIRLLANIPRILLY
jgi:alkaline phosphatase